MRESLIGGNNASFLSLRAGDSEASVLAAAMIMLSVTRRAFETRMPRARPGKIYELLICEIRTILPFTSTGGNELPLPTSARPSVQRKRSAGSASDFEVGLERGKM